MNRLLPMVLMVCCTVLRALADGHHDHHGTDADHHAEHGQRRAQAVGAHRQPGFAEHRIHHARLRRPVSMVADDLPVEKAHLVAGVGGDVRFVGDGPTMVMPFAIEFVVTGTGHDLFAGVAVEVAGRFVGEDQAGLLTSARAMATRC